MLFEPWSNESETRVKTRLESGAGMSFSEFCYPLLQAWDWWHLYHTNGIQLQVGGSDQYGNIIAGMDVINHINKNHYNPIHRVKQNEESFAKPMGFTVPLLTTSSGEKFGKSAGNAVWLDKGQTSCFDLYQYFLRTPDTDVERYLKLFTFLPLTDVSSLVTTHMEAPHKRVAQHKLAYEVLCLVHGDNDARTARDQHAAVFEKASVSTLLGSATSSSPSSTYEPAHPKTTVLFLVLPARTLRRKAFPRTSHPPSTYTRHNPTHSTPPKSYCSPYILSQGHADRARTIFRWPRDLPQRRPSSDPQARCVRSKPSRQEKGRDARPGGLRTYR